VHIPAQFQQIAISVNKNGLASALEQVTASLSLYVDIGCIRAIQVMHDFAQVFIGGFYEEMIVIGHKDIAIDCKSILNLRAGKVFQKLTVVRFCKEYFTPLITTRRNMV
jgi:hypothetical protein